MSTWTSSPPACRNGRNRLGFATDLWSLVIVVFCIKTMIDYAFKSSTLVTPTWHIHFLPFILYAAAGCALIVMRCCTTC